MNIIITYIFIFQKGNIQVEGEGLLKILENMKVRYVRFITHKDMCKD